MSKEPKITISQLEEIRKLEGEIGAHKETIVESQKIIDGNWKKLTKIFDPGFTTKGVKVGVGLGLSICYKIIVDEHRGHVDVSSEPDKGTTFTINLPIGFEANSKD